MQALNRTQPVLRVVPGVPLTSNHRVQAQAVSAIIMCALDVASGKVITKITVTHRVVELIDKKVPKSLRVHIVLDNYAAHKTESVRTWLLAHPRFPVPLHADVLIADVSGREMVLGPLLQSTYNAASTTV